VLRIVQFSPMPGLYEAYHPHCKISMKDGLTVFQSCWRVWGGGGLPRQRRSSVAHPCVRGDSGVKGRSMMRFFDIGDRARLPWRFYGATVSILARA